MNPQPAARSTSRPLPRALWGVVLALGALAACGGGDESLAQDPGATALSVGSGSTPVVFPECPSGTRVFDTTAAVSDTSTPPALATRCQ